MAGLNSNDDTIAAVGTPFGQAAIGIVRLSGPRSIAIADKIFRAKNNKPLSVSVSFLIRYGRIVDAKEKIVDEVIVSLMRGPASYTREDVVEINSHGGARALSSILELVLVGGARLAEPGEFTKRAFLNGRIDLAQAEAVLDIIQAKSDLALKVSLSQLAGDVSSSVGDIRRFILETLADMEAAIDFAEEDISAAPPTAFLDKLNQAGTRLGDLLSRSFQGKIIREGLEVVIYGKPNVGKSSLLNAFLKKERAIVTPIAGTTRDTIEEYVNIKGLAVCLIDSAGILEHRDEIEKKAVRRTQDAVRDCDVVLFVVDGSAALSEEDRILAAQIRGKKTLLAINKCDEPLQVNLAEVERLFNQKAIKVSALRSEHIDQLEGAIFKCVFDHLPDLTQGALISNVRHIDILKRAQNSLATAVDSLRQGLSLEFASLDVKKALEALGELTGETLTEDLLDTIFSKFCIGK